MGELVSMGLDAAELEARARMPPDLLVQMRNVSAGEEPDRGFEWLKQVKQQSPRGFAQDLAKLEIAWREQVAKLERPGGTAEPVEVDPGACLALAERWLREHGVNPEEGEPR